MSTILFEAFSDYYKTRYRDANGNIITRDEYLRGVCRPKKRTQKKEIALQHRKMASLKIQPRKQKPTLGLISPRKTKDTYDGIPLPID